MAMGVQLILRVQDTRWVSSDFPCFTYPAHDPTIAMLSVLPSMYLKTMLKFPAWSRFQSLLSSHMARQKGCLVSHTSSPFIASYMIYFHLIPHTAGQMGFLKTPYSNVLFSVSSWAESPSPRKSFAMSGKSCFWDSLYSSWKRHTLPSGLCFGQTECVCFLHSFPIPFPNPLFCEVLSPTLSQASSFLSLLWP